MMMMSSSENIIRHHFFKVLLKTKLSLFFASFESGEDSYSLKSPLSLSTPHGIAVKHCIAGMDRFLTAGHYGSLVFFTILLA